MNTVYYIVDKNSERRVKWDNTRAGARIAQRRRNSALGFRLRLERLVESDQELELCEGRVTATYAIVEATIESNEHSLLESTELRTP
jgi:hypothetical protein